MRWACESDYLKNCKIVDVNMGCPVPKVFKNGDGSALLTDIKKAEYIIKECVKSQKIITVKIRTGQVRGDDVATDFCKMAEQSGASLVTIHGRVREDYYSGEPDYNAIYKAKNSVKIPIIANGGIFTVEDANLMIDKTGADGVMIARGGIANPFLVSEITNQKPTCNLKDFIKQHVENVKSFYPERRGVLEFRKFVSYYLRGIRDVKQNKLDLYKCQDFNSVLAIIDQIL
jgi:nifR3 family TIM-barrel protein